VAPVIVDYSRARPSITTLKSLGAVGVMRYLSTPADNPKNLTVAEAQVLLAGGLSIGLVWERYIGRPKEGRPAGSFDSAAAEAIADSLGAPLHIPIFMAIDYDTANPAEVEAYLKAAAELKKRPRGVYGERSIIDYYVGRYGYEYGWQTSAWSGGIISAKAHLYQRKYEDDWDINDLLKPLPMWVTAVAPEPSTGVRNPVNDGRQTKVIPGGKVTTPFGTKGQTWMAGEHPGDDWNGVGEDYGLPVLSAVEGKVVAAKANAWPIDAYGNQVVVEDVNGFRTAMCHLARITTLPGGTIRAGQQVGTVGATGRAFGAHCHVERRKSPFGYWQYVAPRYDYPYPTSRVIVVDELVKGSRCASVYWMQRALNRLALGGVRLPLTGYFGAGTLELVKRLQVEKFGDAGDGLLGPKQTQRLLTAADMLTIKVDAS
jgi:murein DD-endopeptidase MepM/ murein hydrolase activator NlpD